MSVETNGARPQGEDLIRQRIREAAGRLSGAQREIAGSCWRTRPPRF